MRSLLKLPMFVVAAALLALILVLALLQYRWLGRISEAEAVRMRSTLHVRASAFAQDFDSELTRAYLLFQVDPLEPGEDDSARLAARADRWQATARYPQIVKGIYRVAADRVAADRAAADDGTALRVHRFNPATRELEAGEWPGALATVRSELQKPADLVSSPDRHLVVRTMPQAVWEDVPALVVPTPIRFLETPGRTAGLRPEVSYTILLLDRDYIVREMLPALGRQHFRETGDGFDYQIAVLSLRDAGVLYRTTETFSPAPDAKVDAAVDLFHVRQQDFGAIAAEVRRFAVFTGGPRGREARNTVRERFLVPGLPDGAPGARHIIPNPEAPAPAQDRNIQQLPAALRPAAAARPGWRLLVKHPSGSLEQAVNTVRRRNLLVSSSILAVLGASLTLLTLSTRRAQEMARQQMAFVAAVSHELRTPLAVIRSAGDNLADGVVHDAAQTRKYGDLVRNEGRRLTDMVEQILEFAGIESGQRGFALQPVAIPPMLHELVESSRALLDRGGMKVEYNLPDGLPTVLGDEVALRRVFQNLLSNAIKYGGGTIELRAARVGRHVHVTFADRGLGIAPAEQSRIFEPFYRAPSAIAAQVQGAGLGLSLVKRIVEAHDGRIVVHSTPDRGSEFVVVLPASGEPGTDAMWSRQTSGESAGA